MRIPRNLRRSARHLLMLSLAMIISSAPTVIFAQASLETIKSLHRGPMNPYASVIQASDGVLYGTTFNGGNFDAPLFGTSGTLFKVNPDGTGYRLLHEFDCYSGTNGCNPAMELIEGSDGMLYGTTWDGGAVFRGTVFRIGKDGTGFALVHSFALCASTSYACAPGGVIEASDGALYGTTAKGGVFGRGSVFRVNKDGSGYELLHSFSCLVSTDGCPSTNFLEGSRAGVIEGSDGRLYGTTWYGGVFDHGVVFAMNKDGTGFELMHEFECPTVQDLGCRPNSGLIEASDGALYGTTSRGPVQGIVGTVFRINTDGTGFNILHYFDDVASGIGPRAGVIEASDGALYGTAVSGGALVGGVLFRMSRDGSDYSIVRSFECGDASTDACRPITGVIEADDGRLYATGIASGPLSLDNGIVYSLEKDGTGFTLVHAFRCGADGCMSEAALTEASDGALYGTMNAGGAYGAGVAFRIQRDGSGYAVLHDFECSATTGCMPLAGELIEASDGLLYGTTSRGGNSGGGTIFGINKDGTGFRSLHSFECAGFAGSCGPTDRLLEASDGALYGTTTRGGTGAEGTLFRIERDGTGFTEIYSLACVTDGCYPEGDLIEASDGALYGVNRSGGPLGAGTAFRINRDGTGFTVLHPFQSVATDGTGPVGGLTEGSDGALYGATLSGGASFRGTVYRLNRDGTGFALLHSLVCNGDGCNPRDGVIEGSDGMLYGTASIGTGATSKGSVFRLRRDGTDFEVLHPFVFPCTGDNGCFPYARVIEASDGSFYGTTREGGGGAGILFRMTLNLVSVPPTLVVTTPEPGAVIPEGLVPVEGTASDDVAVASVTVDDIAAVLTPTGNPNDANEVSFSVPVSLAVGDHTFEVIAGDDDGNTETVQLDVHVVPADGTPPRVSDVVADPNPVEVGAPVLLTADIDDSATGGSIIVSAGYTVEGGQPVPMSPTDGTFDTDHETVDAEIPGLTPSGVYELCVTAVDEAGNAGGPDCTLLAVYDPGAGFVTGGGWIDSMPGAYRPDRTSAANGSFGFVAKYVNGSSIPIGSTEFQLHELGLNFHSSGYEWLVVTGDHTAQYKGAGTVNGSPAPNGTPYQFMVWVSDGQPDTFRLRIWWEDTGQEIELYDSETSIPGGGSIVVH